MIHKKIKLSDIAQELDVSVGTVSLVLSGKAKQSRIGKKMVERVIAKADEMGYQANIMARSLRTGKSGIIGLAVADIANPYFGRMARYIENEASKLDYQVMFSSSDENASKLASILNTFQSRQVDGQIVVPVENCHLVGGISNCNNIPTVFIDRDCNNLEADVVCTDNFVGAVQLNNILLNKGYKKIAAFVYSLQLSNFFERINGYEAALADIHSNAKTEIYYIDFNNVEIKLKQALQNALNSGCDAFFFANNSLGIKSLRILREMDPNLLTRIGIVSFDNPEIFELSTPRVTCWEQPIEEMSRKAIELLIDKINNHTEEKCEEIRLKGKLILRDSQ